MLDTQFDTQFDTCLILGSVHKFALLPNACPRSMPRVGTFLRAFLLGRLSVFDLGIKLF